MGTWGPGVFQNDDALEFADSLAEDFYARIEEFFAEDEPEFFDYGEGEIIPRLALFTHLSRLAYDAVDPVGRCAPPQLEIVREWKRRYLEGFDAGIDQFESDPDYKRERRSLVVGVFEDLENLVSGMMETFARSREEKLTEIESLVKQEPEDANARQRLAEMYLELERWQDCIDTYEKAISLGMADWSEGFARNNIAWSMAQLERYDDALRTVEKAISIEHPAPQFFGTRGFVLSKLSKYDEALSDLNKALQEHDSAEEMCLDPTLAETHFWRAQVYEMLGDKEASAKDFETAEKLGFKSSN